MQNSPSIENCDPFFAIDNKRSLKERSGFRRRLDKLGRTPESLTLHPATFAWERTYVNQATTSKDHRRAADGGQAGMFPLGMGKGVLSSFTLKVGVPPLGDWVARADTDVGGTITQSTGSVGAESTNSRPEKLRVEAVESHWILKTRAP